MSEIERVLGNGVICYDRKVILKDKSKLLEVINILKSNSKMQFTNITDIVGVDEESEGIKIVYVLSSVRYSERVEVIVRVLDNEVDSITSLFSGGDWLEREVYDMLGVIFKNHKNLRRILTDYGFKGAPLLKSFKN